MAIREYADENGILWSIWQVVPTRRRAFPRVASERRSRDIAVGHDRRRRNIVTPGLEGGWLCFESEVEKRRLVPIPADWESCPDEKLESYLSASEVAPRRIIESRAGAGEGETAAAQMSSA